MQVEQLNTNENGAARVFAQHLFLKIFNKKTALQSYNFVILY